MVWLVYNCADILDFDPTQLCDYLHSKQISERDCKIVKGNFFSSTVASIIMDSQVNNDKAVMAHPIR